MVFDRTTKIFIAIFTLIATILVLINHLIDQNPIGDWGLAGLLFIISLVFWVWLWQEDREETTTALATADTHAASPAEAAVKEWVISKDVVAALEDAVAEPDSQVAESEASADIPVAEPEPLADEITELQTETEETPVEAQAEPEVVEEAPAAEAESATEVEAQTTEGEPEAGGPADAEEEVLVMAEDAVFVEQASSTETELSEAQETVATSDAETEPEAIEDVPVVEATPVTEAAPTEAAPTGDEPDDLQRIEGIGEKYSETLIAAGVFTFAQIAGMTEEQLTAIIKDAGMRRPSSIVTWAEQAALAAAHDWDALDKLQEELIGGRRA